MFQQLGRLLSAGEDGVLVTVVASSGSTPRGAGAHMLVSSHGRIAGTIGGGAVEYQSERTAVELLSNGESRMEHFYLNKNEIQDLGMVCGGEVLVHFRHFSGGDPAALALVKKVQKLFRKGDPCWLITELTQEEEGGMSVYSPKNGLFGSDVPRSILCRMPIHSKQIELEGRLFYCENLSRPGKVYIFGGGHVAQKLVPALAAVDFRCVVLEDREEFCHPNLFPGVEETRLIQNDHALDYVDITEEDYVVVMTRGHKDDTVVQSQVLRTPARYIGVIGSRQKTRSIFALLREMGFTDEDLQRITTPIGLAIQAETPAEIAVSITAQLIQERAQRAKAAET